MRIDYKTLAGVVIFSMVWLFVGPKLLEEYFSINSILREFIGVAALSVLGVVLFILKNHYNVNHHLIDSMEMLIIGITPTTASFRLIAIDDYGRILMPVFLVVITVFWFIYFGFIVKAKEHTNSEEIAKERRRIKEMRIITFVVFACLLTLEIALFSGILSVNTIL